MTNNGFVYVSALNFEGDTQTLQGTGILSSTTATVFGSTRLNFGSNHHLYNLHVQGTGPADLGGHTVILDQNGAPLAVTGILSTTGSNVVYNGTLTQTIAFNNVRYHRLTISNTAVAIAPNIELYVAGDFTHKSVFKHSNGTLFMNGAQPQTINGVNTDFYRLTVTNTRGVTITTNTSVTSTLVLSGDIHIQDDKVMTFAGTSRGDYDVFGTIKRSGFVTNTGYMFGSPYMVITPTAGLLMPSEISFTLQGSAPNGLLFPLPRTYIITPNFISAFTATVQLHYRDSELGSIGELTLQMWRSNLLQWMRYQKQAWDTDKNWLQRRDVTDFSTWALAVGYVNFLRVTIR
ncbi:MAG: hypothetical protein LC737_02200 [Chloroflexi bacterium]|nr:hypothetical protein [Chloroflexota bacterium]